MDHPPGRDVGVYRVAEPPGSIVAILGGAGWSGSFGARLSGDQ